MNSEKRSITLRGLTTLNMIYLLLSSAMILVSAYLTNHFYDLHFPQGLGQASTLCNINDFFSCDKTTLSAFSNLAGIPISLGGIFMGLIGVIGAFVQSEGLEKTNKLLSYINAVGCIILFIISSIVLKSICPFCFLYYILSIAVAALFYLKSDYSLSIDPKLGGIYLLLLAVPAGLMANYYSTEQNKKEALGKQYIQQFNQLKDYGKPLYVSPFRLHTSGQKFEDAKIRITVFSDFQCPFCQKVAEELPKAFEGFEKDLEVQYMFYPLDNLCNTKMQRSLHAYACKAAYLAACSEEKFLEIHDYIFEHQNELSSENLDKWEKDFGLSNCLENPKTADYVQQSLNAGTQYELRSTPTMIINGRKLEGALPTVHLRTILKSLLEK